ncbi:MAG: phosphoserine phosphatase SerB [Methanosarcinaceae archaeon]|nr:phosphoserine phosphatase SerB [Methanosarcinaceae archaeon]
MDSTLVDAETIDELARAAGAVDEVSKITAAAMRGEVDFTESLKQRVAFLKGLSVEAAKEAVMKMPLMNGAPDLLAFIQSYGVKTAMITSGFRIAAEDVGKSLNIDYVFSNELGVKDGVLDGTASGLLTTTNSKEKVLDLIVKETGIPYEECVIIADGANDICLFRKAGFSIAFNAKPAVQAAAGIAVAEKDLRSVIPIVRGLFNGVYDDLINFDSA